MSKRLTIRLSYDLVSPWSYFAYVVLKRYRPIWDFELILNPVWLGGTTCLQSNRMDVKLLITGLFRIFVMIG
ncbi:hypothetical protein PGT21_031306 [Puccinia graminis f. sp. tritici]|uniref:DSBA-like thioredoxin domain-containing protein n=1 Tax=Puccinia graminis f. sp. tritici TaxID=56615 RepID=A0A5B0M920_PUCGR|nr:hypothetical protein PGTUg99_002759 [Puccinia graminis f. sp. tritici]KAA1075212.1 hypothetical protein PGT21_031306 [Puccinia graminis f. sp. tritici]